MVSGASTTWCFVSDMEKAVTFYHDFLGLTPHVISPYWSDFTVGGMSIGLHPGAKPGVKSGNWTLGLETQDLKALRQKAIDKRVTVVDDYHQTPTGVVLTFADPDGNHVQVIQPGTKLKVFED